MTISDDNGMWRCGHLRAWIVRLQGYKASPHIHPGFIESLAVSLPQVSLPVPSPQNSHIPILPPWLVVSQLLPAMGPKV
jgi:hypothetical protein